MIYKINGENPFQVLSDSFSVSPSESGYQLQISADGKNYTNFATVAANTTKQFTGMNNGNFYRLSGNTSEVTINWMRECKSSGGSGGGSGSTVTWNQIVTGGTKIAEISIDGASTDVYAPEGGDSKSLVNFDETSQADRAALYTELKDINDGGSGNTINSNYDFYKTLNSNQGVKFEYYGFDSADTLVLGAVVASGDSSVYEQVVKIQSGGTVQVETNAVGGGGAQDYVIVEALSAITSPTEGMIAYVPAHNETYTGYTISNADGNLFGQVYLKHYNPREHSMMVYEQDDEGFISVTQGEAAYGFGNDGVFRYIYRNQVALKYDDANKLFTILYKPGRFNLDIYASQEYYSETSGTTQVPAQMYIYKYGKWHLYEDGKISYYLNTISEAEYDEMYQDVPQMSEGEVQFIVDDFYYGWSTYRFESVSSKFANGAFYGHTFFCRASNGESMDDNKALSIKVEWSQNEKGWGIAKYSNFVGVQQTVTGGTKIATITVNGEGTDLYAPPIVALSQSDYDALVSGGTVDSSTLYVII